MQNYLKLISAQFDELQQSQPLLEINIMENKAVITGAYCVYHIFNGEEFSAFFEIEVTFTDNFPQELPVIKEIGGRVRRIKFEHIYPDRTLCLEVDTRIKMELDSSPTLVFFFERFVLTYFINYLFFEKHRKLPFGERSHSATGILEFYCEMFGVDDVKVARILLSYVCGKPVKGHHPCPCQSGNRYRNCHRSKVNELQASKYYSLFESDYKLVAGR